jgi:hypothetical protein
MYAGHDGNVYKNTGSGWEKYDNGSWNSVKPPSSTYGGQRNTGAMNAGSEEGGLRGGGGNTGREGFAPESLNQEMQNRQRGAMESERFSEARSGGFGRFGGGGGRFGGFHGRR